MTPTEIQDQIAENRRRYEALKAAGTGQAPKAMPEPTPIGATTQATPPILEETVPGGWYATYRLKAGQCLRLTNVTGCASVALVAWNASDTSERINHADSIKIQWTAALAKGRLIFSDMGRVLFSIVEDTSGAHDVLAGGLNISATAAKFGDDPTLRNTRDNLVLAAGKFGLDRRDIPQLVTFFAPVAVGDDGSLRWKDGIRRAGDFVELRAEMDLLVALSNCPHPLDPAATYAPGPVEVTVLPAQAVNAADFCRTATPEAIRGFENTDAYRTL